MEETRKPYTLGEEDKATPVMVYTANSLLVGEVVTKKVIRVSTWLRTPMVPQYVALHSAQILDLSSGGNPRSLSLSTLYLPSHQVVAFHMRPPESDPLDYDPDEPMRRMEPVTVLIGPFRFDGSLRISTQTDLENYLDVIIENFTSLYDVRVSAPNLPALKPFQVSFALLR
ncbi:MAG: hypothetical protein ACWGO1_05795, partial [Anaerolineales bacterium]